MKILIGDTGLVGKSLQRQTKFDLTFNSKNINEFLNLVEDGHELYLSCLPAAKWQVNQNIPADLKNINNIINIISQRSYSRVYLFSTIDVYCDSPLDVDEDYAPNIKKFSYGANRYLFELLVRDLVCKEDLKIIRLPALYNNELKKNIIYDLLHNNNVDKINPNSAYQWLNLDTMLSKVNSLIEDHPKETVFNMFPAPIETKAILRMFPYQTNPDGPRIEYRYKTKFSRSGYIVNAGDAQLALELFIDGALHK